MHGSSNFCRRPCLTRQGSRHFSHCLRRHKEEACRVPFFLQGSPAGRRGGAGMVPPISVGAPASYVRVSYFFQIASGVTERKSVRFLLVLEGPPAARQGEVCMVPPISAGAPASRVRVSYVFHIASGVRGRKRVGFLIFCRGSLLPGGREGVWFLQFLQASLPHASVYPPCFTLPQASGGGSVQGSSFFGGIPRC